MKNFLFFIIGIQLALIYSLLSGTEHSLGGTKVAIFQGGTGSSTAPTSQLLYGGATAYQSVATSTAQCSGSVSCSTFTVVGSVSPVITSASLLTYDAWTHNISSNSATSSNIGIGTSTPYSRLHVSNGAAATTTVTIGEIGLTTSKACVNMNRSDGGAGSFYINGVGALVAENIYCR